MMKMKNGTSKTGTGRNERAHENYKLTEYGF